MEAYYVICIFLAMKPDKYLTSLFEITVNPKIDMLLEV